MKILVTGDRHTVSEQPIRRSVLADGTRRLLEVLLAGRGIGGGQRLGVQFLDLLAIVVEVVFRVRPRIEIVAFRVVHQGKLIVAIGVHVLQPSGEFHIIDVQVDADLGKLALKLVAKFGTIRVGIGEGELQRLVGGVSGFAQQFLGLGWIVRVQAGQVLVARIDG